MLFKVYEKRETNGTDLKAFFANIASALLDGTDEVKSWGITSKATSSIVASLVQHYKTAVEPDVRAPFCLVISF